MTRLHFFHAEAIDVRKNYSYGASIRELWFKEPNGKEGSIEFSVNLPVRRGNRIGLIYDNHRRHYVAIINFSTEQYFNYVPEVRSARYDPFPGAGWFYNWFFRQKLTSPYGNETEELHKRIEDLVDREVIAYRKFNAR